MKILKVEIYKLNVELKYPIRIPIGVLDAARNVVIKITTDSGIYGWGEASPFEPITGDSQGSNYLTAQQLGKLIKGKNPLAIEQRMAEINAFTVGESSIRSAFNMALYDIAAKAANMPLYQFLGGEYREIKTDVTIGLQDTVEQTIAKASGLIKDGFTSIKMKVGRKELKDIAHIKAVRELAGDEVIIKVDSNQGWSYSEAVANIKAMEPYNLQYCEQPLKAWDYENLARLRNKIDLPLCADESIFDDKDALKLIKLGAVDYLNIKLGKSGGISTALKINAIAQANGTRCMIGCFMESLLGLSASAHLAMAFSNIAFIDLDSAYHFKNNVVIGGMKYDEKIGNLIHLNNTPGLGAEFSPEALDKASYIVV